MLLILASPRDEVARQLAARWKAQDACLLTPRDLSAAGWNCELPTFALRGIISGRSFAASEIRGVLSRLPRVAEEDLWHIVAEDRGYVAAEMTAFLTAWLSRLGCPVVNAPTAGSLAGPEWRRERWVHLAAQLGMHVSALELGTETEDEVLDSESLASLTIIGDAAFGNAAASLAGQVRRMVRVAGVEMLTAFFDGSTDEAKFVDASPWPVLSTYEASDLVLQAILRESRC